MKVIPSQDTKLVRLRLVATESFFNPKEGISKELNVEVEHDIQFSGLMDLKEDRVFSITMETKLKGLDSEEDKVLNLYSKYEAGYKLLNTDVSDEDIKEATTLFGDHLYIHIREHISFLLHRMNVNPGFLPFSIDPDSQIWQK